MTENWDDDFEFNPNSPPRKKKFQNITSTSTSNTDDGIAQKTRMSTTSSRLTVDWDAEMDSPMNTSSSHKAKVFTAPNLSDWAEPGPSTPSRRPVFGPGKLNLTVPTDNWDDDFEDKDDNTPLVRRTRTGQGDQSASSPTKEITRNFRSMQPLPKTESLESPSTPGRNRASSSASTNYYRSHKSTSRHPLSGDLADGEDDEDEDEFGFMDKDEDDKTLTGRSSRRAGYPGGRLNSLNSVTSATSTSHPFNLTPPPPVPSLPAHLTGGRDTHPEPFPRSPSSSVFSLPTTIAGDSVHYGSTAYLHPIASRTSSSGGGSGRGGGGGGGAKVFSKLPPSPPIHKERERRRLRKKSRPQPQGVFELIPVESGLAALQEVERNDRGGEGYYRTSREREESPGRESARSGTSHSLSRPRTPQRPLTPQSPVSATSPLPMGTGTSAFVPAAANVNATPSSKRHSASSNLPPTPSSSTKGSALLSRIGSVKKWGVRRKRGESISQNNLPGSPEGPDTSMDSGTLARPTSSLSSLPSTASSHHASSRPTSPPTSKQNWFFRNSDTFTTGSGASASVKSAGGQGYPYAYANSSRNHSHQNSYHQYHSRGSKTDVRGGSTTELRGSKTDLRSRPGSTTDLGLGSFLPSNLGFVRTDRSQPEGRARRPSESARDRKRTPSQSRTREGEEASEKDTPSKLLKRKSLGFVQLRRTIASLGGNGGDASDSSKGSSSAAAGQPRHVSYGDVSQKSGNGRADVFQDRQNLDMPPPPHVTPDGARDRKKSLLKIKSKQDVTDGEKDDKKDAGKGFIRSVRRISIVGRHRREKSMTTSPAAIVPGVEKAARPSLGSRSIAEETKDVKATEAVELAPSQDPLPPPLPAIEDPSSPAAESEAKEANAPVEEVMESIPVALPQTPPRKRPTVTSNPTTPPTSPTLATMTAKSPASPTSRGPTTSPQTASLGRSTYSPTRKNASPDEKVALRRCSLGDLKIPARISQAQVGLRRDLGMVREFAHNVEQLKELQATYHDLVVEIQEVLDSHAHLHATQQVVARSVSPSFFLRPVGRKRSNTNPGPTPDPTRQLAYKQLASAFYTINSKYRITWECAELLIELGGGSSTVPGPPAPTTSVSAPVMQANGDEGSSLTRRMGRERAITLAGDESTPPSPLPGMKSGFEAQNGATVASSSSAAWRASTGRQELSQRQMILLKELLNNADSSFITSSEDVKPSIQEERSPSVNKEWKWGDPSNSTITLPPSESSGAPSSTSSTNAVNISMKKTRTSRLGMSGLRDLLKMLKRHHTAHPIPSFQSTSSLATNITNSSSDLNRGYPSTSDLHRPEAEKAATYGRRRAKTSLGPDVVPSPFSIYDSTPLPTRQSRGRPSLASIFRIPNSLKPHKVSGSHAAQASEPAGGGGKQARNVAETGESSSPAEEDWDQIDSATDLDKGIKSSPSPSGRGDAMATIRGRKGQSPYLQQPAPLLPSLLNGGRTSPKPRVLNATSSQTSLYEDSPTNSSYNVRSTRLSNVDENAASGPHAHNALQLGLNLNSNTNVNVAPLIPPLRLSSRYPGVAGTNKMSSVRSMPPQPMAELRLAMTPENIKPLVENAKEVNGRLVECIAEIRTLLESHKAVVVVEPLRPPKKDG
ncbi:hypothetical protein M378DRAFT_198963 [Amanita muscaria Koide BX008]|uniref:Uncharacterized protein n=1 Tax=Amanita muscaria (strain Koide BX008) TaxID=946122 RepID=A0A0C2SIP1_AMAMK|nr:hypothetical protein M378DRAFT_198963 [Amanita muscaria Koide BX008]